MASRLCIFISMVLIGAHATFAAEIGGGSGGGGGGIGTVTSVSAANGVETVSGSAITDTGTIRQATCIRAVTGTTDTILSSDRGCFVTYNNASGVAITLPQAGTTGFESKFVFTVVNLGAGQITVDPTTSLINGTADLDLSTNQGATIVSNGIDYFYNAGIGIPSNSFIDGTVKAVTWADSFPNALRVTNGSNVGTVIYTDATLGPQVVCLPAGGTPNDCDYIRKLASGKKWEIQNSGGTPIITISESTGALTNTKYDAEGTGNILTLKAYKWLPGAGCNNATASTVWDLPASNPAVAACRTGTNTTKGVLDFADGANALTAQYTEYLWEDWTGAIDATIIYEANSTSTNNTVWQLAIACAGDGDSDDPAFTDDVFTADAGKSTANTYNPTAVNTITTTGTCAAGKIMHIRLKRDPAHASDTLAATARFVGLALKLREAQ